MPLEYRCHHMRWHIKTRSNLVKVGGSDGTIYGITAGIRHAQVR